MEQTHPKGDTDSSSLASLLKPDLLAVAMPSTQSNDISSREQVKSLLGRSAPLRQNANDSYGERLLQAHQKLCEDFFAQRPELSKLNRARKQQIEDHLRKAGQTISFDKLVQAMPGSREHTILQSLAEQCATFYLAQLLLLRRWIDMDLIPADQVWNGSRTINWKITSVLKKKCPQQIIHRNEWNFLKANIFSWYTPSSDTWEKIRALVLTQKPNAAAPYLFPSGPRESERHRASLLAQLLLQQTGERKNLALYGAWDSTLLFRMLEIQAAGNIMRIHSQVENEFEQYLAEILALWTNAPQMPKFSATLKQTSTPSTSHQSQLEPGTHMHPDAWDGIIILASKANPDQIWSQALAHLDCLGENGILLLAADTYWPMEANDSCRRFRDIVTRKAAIESIIDARQLVNTQIPRCITVLRRSNHKEQRDCFRPHIIRLKGDGTRLDSIAEPLLALLAEAPSAGEQVQSTTDSGIRLESMVAATVQGDLRSAPWTMLSNQNFFEVALSVRRTPQRIFNQGSLVPNQSQLINAPERSLHFVEIPGLGLYSGASLNDTSLPENARRYIYVPDQGTAESLRFFSAWFNSSLLQFWYRLESDQTQVKNRTAEKLLKLSPVQRLNLAPSPLRTPTAFTLSSAHDCRESLAKIWGLELQHSWPLHDWIVATDTLLEKKLRALREIIRHLFPDLSVERWAIPNQLPILKAGHAFKALLHLPQAPVAQHPALQITGTRSKNEFRIQDIHMTEHGPVAALHVRGHNSQALQISGPTLYLRAIHDQLQANIGKNSLEILKDFCLPLDAKLVLSQVDQFQELIALELKGVHEIVQLLDLVFCRLAGLSCSLNDPGQTSDVSRFVGPLATPTNMLAERKFTTAEDFANTKEIR